MELQRYDGQDGMMPNYSRYHLMSVWNQIPEDDILYVVNFSCPPHLFDPQV